MYTMDTFRASETMGGRLAGAEGLPFEKIITDSRNISLFDKSLFFAIKGGFHDGHDYIGELYDKGVRSFVVERELDFGMYPEASFIVVDSTVAALQALASFKRGLFTKPVVAISGSNGKTIVKEWLYWLLSPFYKITRSPKSYNSQIGVPLSLWLLNEDSDFAIIEAGISKVGEMRILEQMIRPDIGVLTNIGSAHQSNFATMEQKTAEKMCLLRHCRSVVLSCDNEVIASNMPCLGEVQRLIRWSQKDDNADVQLSDIRLYKNSSKLMIKTSDSYYNIHIPFNDKGSIQNTLICFCVLKALDIDITPKIIKRFTQLPRIKMRLETLDGINNSVIINDTYNSDINSLEIALDYLNEKCGHKKTVLILSDILQNNENETELSKIILDIIMEKQVSMFVGIGRMLYTHASIFPEGSEFYLSTDDFLETASLSRFSEKAILLKGAREFAFEKISKRLQSKNHLSVIETDLTLMRHNLMYFRSMLHPATKIMVMVKAFSYGSGYREVAAFLQHNRVDYLTVAFTDEGTELRKYGIELPIMVMNANVQSLQTMIEYNLEPEIYSMTLLRELVKELSENRIAHFPVHIKLDTGMHRLGLCYDELPEMCELIKQSGKIDIVSVFSHFVGSDNPALDDFTRSQVALFSRMYDQIVALTGVHPLRHIANTAGIVRFPEYHFDMVRLGIGLYGLMTDFAKEQVPVSTFRSVISQIHRVKAGETVSYNRSGKVDTDAIIATVPVGYADGFDRRLGNGHWHFIINGQKAPTIGNVCMDMCMVNITGINAKEGDDVIIFGQENTINDMAKILKTISYEVITGISQRVKRVYFEE